MVRGLSLISMCLHHATRIFAYLSFDVKETRKESTRIFLFVLPLNRFASHFTIFNLYEISSWIWLKVKDFFFLDEEKWIVYTEIKIESFEKIKVKISHERNKFKIMWNCKNFLLWMQIKKKKEETYWHTGVSVTFERIAKRWLYVGWSIELILTSIVSAR